MLQKFTKSLGLIVLAGLASLAEAQPQFKWSAAGPVYTAGRARNMIVDKTDPAKQRFYLGSASSGVFVTTNGGANWAALNDQGAIKNISYMAQGPDGTIYAATGEGFLRKGQKAKALLGTGLYKVGTSSLTIVADSSITGNVINRIAISPVNSADIVLGTNKGVLISHDGGANFALAAGIPTHSLNSGQDVEFDGNGVLYCSVGSEKGAGASLTVTATKVYKSTDASLSNFTAITPTSSLLADLNYGRIELAVAPSNNNVIYASCANKNPDGNSVSAASLKAFYVSYDAGVTWALIIQGSSALDPLSNGGTRASGDYAHTIVVDPTDHHKVYYGGFFMYVFKRKVGAPGDSNTAPIGDWMKVGNPYALNTQIYLKENIHDVQFIPGSPNRYYFVTDAGIYRSFDLIAIQPFYKGLVTGQFNSVSIERYPQLSSGTSNTYIPVTGFVGGTGANGMTYFSGTSEQVTYEINYLSEDIYNSEFSKILPEAAFATRGTGETYRSSNVKNSSPALLKMNSYKKALSKVEPTPEDFTNVGVTTGTPFKLWEWYGQTPVNPDSVYFYNDTVRHQASVGSVPELITATNFVFTAIRPNSNAMIDSIVILTGTVVIPPNVPAPAFNTPAKITLKLDNNYTNASTLTTITGTNIAYTGSVSTTQQPTVTLNNVTFNDQINVTFSAPPFANKTGTSSTVNNAAFYRVFATVFYKYKAGDQVIVKDANISTKPLSYTVTIPRTLRWTYKDSTLQAYTINVTKSPALSNPTFVLSSPTQTSTTPSFTVKPLGVKSYTIRQYGDYTVAARPVIYTLTATTDTNIPGSSYTFALLPTTLTASRPSTVASVSFTVNPLAPTVYTIVQTGSGTTTAETSFTVNPASYLLNPGGVSQPTNIFTISTLPGDPTVSYTLTGVSSNTLYAANTTTSVSYPVQTVTNNVGTSAIPLASDNPRVKVPSLYSARIAMGMNNSYITGNADAVVVSKNPLALNDAMNFVRVSQTGARTDDANGNATTNTISVEGKVTVIEWSKSGMELYYATDANKLYRVSHITEVSDLSPASEGGKFYTDVFKYADNGPNAAALNPASPYRTTLLGAFDRPITSISVNKFDTSLVVTFNNAANTGTTGIVVYSTNNVRKANSTSIGWVNKTDQNLAGNSVYCSMVEKMDQNSATMNNTKVYLGTNAGIFYTDNIVNGVWTNINNSQLPSVQIFDIEQQTLPEWDCYNTGQIYVATYGRGVWTNNDYLRNYVVGEEENYADITEAVESRLNLFPNPAQGEVNVRFEGLSGEKAVLQVMDLSGRTVKTSELGVLESGEATHKVSTNELNAGVYIINVSSDSGIKRVAKLIISK